MNIPLRRAWKREEFFAWAAEQEGRYEFDGLAPVGMTGGTVNHAMIMRNLHRALDRRLRGEPAGRWDRMPASPRWAMPCAIPMRW
jgi:hypothetical protein